MKYFGWRRAEFSSWLKWVPAVEQLEIFDGGLTPGDSDVTLDTMVSVSALDEDEVHCG